MNPPAADTEHDCRQRRQLHCASFRTLEMREGRLGGARSVHVNHGDTPTRGNFAVGSHRRLQGLDLQFSQEVGAEVDKSLPAESADANFEFGCGGMGLGAVHEAGWLQVFPPFEVSSSMSLVPKNPFSAWTLPAGTIRYYWRGSVNRRSLILAMWWRK